LLIFDRGRDRERVVACCGNRLAGFKICVGDTSVADWIYPLPVYRYEILSAFVRYFSLSSKALFLIGNLFLKFRQWLNRALMPSLTVVWGGSDARTDSSGVTI